MLIEAEALCEFTVLILSTCDYFQFRVALSNELVYSIVNYNSTFWILSVRSWWNFKIYIALNFKELLQQMEKSFSCGRNK